MAQSHDYNRERFQRQISPAQRAIQEKALDDHVGKASVDEEKSAKVVEEKPVDVVEDVTTKPPVQVVAPVTTSDNSKK